MPWSTPTLKDVRKLTRDYVLSQLGARTLIPNSALRIMSDAKAGLAHLVLLYIDWLAKQLVPDTAEQEWLDRHGNIWLRNADGSKGRKAATFAAGSLTFTGASGTVIPAFSVLRGSNSIDYQTTEDGEIGGDGTGSAAAEALTAGIASNLTEGDVLSFIEIIAGVDGQATVVEMDGGVDEENDDQLRERVLERIQKPPMGGDVDDYVAWAKGVAGVTRAWASDDMGPGTVIVWFMMDDLRADNRGIPTADDVANVQAYLDTMRPVAVKDLFVEAPVPLFYDLTIANLATDTPTVRGKIEDAIKTMELKRSRPGQTMYRSWVDEAIAGAVGEDHHELTFTTTAMPEAGNMPFVGTILYA